MTLPDKERTKARVRELERRLADLRARWPAHSVPAALMAELDELEEELTLARRKLAGVDRIKDADDKE